MKNTISGKLTRIEEDDNYFTFNVQSKQGWAIITFKRDNGTTEMARSMRLDQPIEFTFEILAAEEATV